jgi:hypothetical protein
MTVQGPIDCQASDLSKAGATHEPAAAGERKLRFAIICPGLSLPAWQAACLRHLLASGVAEPVLLIIETTTEQPPARGFGQLFQGIFRGAMLKRLSALQTIDVTGEFGQLPAMDCRTVQHDGHALSLCPEDIARLRFYRLDFILHFTFAMLAGEILTVSRFGLWSYHWRPEDRDGLLTAFWAYYRGCATQPRALLRLTGGRPDALHRGSFAKGASFARSLDGALFGSADWCARVCRQLSCALEKGHNRLPLIPGFATRHPVPRNLQVTTFLARRLGAFVAGAFRRCFLLEYWNIGIVDAPVERIVAAGRPEAVRWLPPPAPLRYRADTCALEERPDAILFEEYSYAEAKGWIAALDLARKADAPRSLDAFGRATHRSYPFLFTAGDGAIFCVPESAEDRRVDLYRASRFPDKWHYVRTLVEDFPALDSTVFFHGGRWWLLCTSGEAGGAHKLHAWHAEALLDPWHPHRLNPLKCDVTSSRPAGRPFYMDGALHRPAQDCSRAYGGAITINRIVKLTPDEFEEIAAGRIEPNASSGYCDGLHTLAPIGNRTIIDGKRLVIDLRAGFLKAGIERRKRRHPQTASAAA